MAWMTYISHWFDEDDWYEGQQRVRIICLNYPFLFYVLTFFLFIPLFTVLPISQAIYVL